MTFEQLFLMIERRKYNFRTNLLTSSREGYNFFLQVITEISKSSDIKDFIKRNNIFLYLLFDNFKNNNDF